MSNCFYIPIDVDILFLVVHLFRRRYYISGLSCLTVSRFIFPKPKMKLITLLPRFFSTSGDYEAQNHIHTFHLPSWFHFFVPFVAREEERGV